MHGIHYFPVIFVLFDFFVFGFVSSVLSQEMTYIVYCGNKTSTQSILLFSLTPIK